MRPMRASANGAVTTQTLAAATAIENVTVVNWCQSLLLQGLRDDQDKGASMAALQARRITPLA